MNSRPKLETSHNSHYSAKRKSRGSGRVEHAEAEDYSFPRNPRYTEPSLITTNRVSLT